MLLSFKMALRSIGANKLRAVLTMLGIIIGVLALVVLVSLVSGTTNTVTDAVSGLGSSLMTVSLEEDTVDLDQIDQWAEEAESVGKVSVSQSASVTGKHEGNSGTVTVYGVTPDYYDIQGLQLLMGRWLKSVDLQERSYVCIINETTADELIGYLDCVGQTLNLNGVEYTVVGILEDDEDSLTALFSSGSMVAYVPYDSLIRLTDSLNREVDTFYASAAEGHTLEEAEAELEKILMEHYEMDEDAFDISSSNILEETMSSITNVLTILLGGIAGISLVVGGIGIMNIMLVTVTERTREIGIRKAIGASRGTILTQFLMEAVVLCMMGCCLGIFLSWSILQVVNTVVASLDLVFTLNGGVVLTAVVFCFIIGVLFGLYPANKAAKMKPIDALHYGG